MQLFKDNYLLEKAYLSIAQQVPSVPSDDEEQEPELEQTDSTAMDGEIGVEVPGPEEESMDDELHHPSEVGLEAEPNLPGNEHDEMEEDRMAVDNLNSVRESAMKIANHWSKGSHLHPWQQQKLAIAMELLAEVARALR
jgi:hypothetical protein